MCVGEKLKHLYTIIFQAKIVEKLKVTLSSGQQHFITE